MLLPIGFGIIIGNIPFFKGFGLGIYESNSVLHYLYFGGTSGLYSSIVFLGFTVGASTQADVFLTVKSLGIFLLGSVAFSIATASGIIYFIYRQFARIV